jgi:hypothetical protein
MYAAMPADRHACRLAVPLAAALALALPGIALGACPGEDAAPADPAAASATLCLLNAERAAQGLGPLAASATLGAAAAGHAADMVARAFFEHVSPDGGTLQMRLRAAGWMPASGSWSAGEDLAWGSGSLGTPARIVAAWMNSAGHRANILQPGFTQVGIGIAAAAPRPGVQAEAGTYVADFGAQSAPLAAATGADLAAATAAIAAAAAPTARVGAGRRSPRGSGRRTASATRKRTARSCRSAGRRSPCRRARGSRRS